MLSFVLTDSSGWPEITGAPQNSALTQTSMFVLSGSREIRVTSPVGLWSWVNFYWPITPGKTTVHPHPSASRCRWVRIRISPIFSGSGESLQLNSSQEKWRPQHFLMVSVLSPWGRQQGAPPPHLLRNCLLFYAILVLLLAFIPVYCLKYLFIWQCRVFLVARGVFSCSTQKLFGCNLWDLVPWPGIEPGSSALGTSLSHGTTREVPTGF